jgi:hypothetical protein
MSHKILFQMAFLVLFYCLSNILIHSLTKLFTSPMNKTQYIYIYICTHQHNKTLQKLLLKTEIPTCCSLVCHQIECQRILVFWDITPCSLLYSNLYFRGTGLKDKPSKKSVQITLQHWKWRQCVPQKHEMTFSELQGITPQRQHSSYPLMSEPKIPQSITIVRI